MAEVTRNGMPVESMTGTSRSAAASHMPPMTPATSLSERNALADS